MLGLKKGRAENAMLEGKVHSRLQKAGECQQAGRQVGEWSLSF